ncbi:MAG: hypothetical protein SFU84_10155 [Gemmatimonadales bacterium]|nr:hypothetical protein [Gemmatimonadales bacterium]
MPAPLFSRLTIAAALLTVAATVAAITSTGGAVFSPGGLHAGDSTLVSRGGVTSHAELVNQCGACHAAPWGGEPMAARCLACHDDIQAELRDSSALHAGFPEATGCRGCHDEHLGPAGELTRMAGLGSAHAQFGFPLDGAHERVACRDCHTPTASGAGFSKVPKTCVGCHRDDDTHRGSLGEDCASCHTTATWTGATFDHDVFPIDHGSDGPVPCKTCHQDRSNYKLYTCYGCHEHTPARIQAEHRGEVNTTNLNDCVRCHKGGGSGEGEERGEGGDDH